MKKISLFLGLLTACSWASVIAQEVPCHPFRRTSTHPLPTSPTPSPRPSRHPPVSRQLSTTCRAEKLEAALPRACISATGRNMC